MTATGIPPFHPSAEPDPHGSQQIWGNVWNKLGIMSFMNLVNREYISNLKTTTTTQQLSIKKVRFWVCVLLFPAFKVSRTTTQHTCEQLLPHFSHMDIPFFPSCHTINKRLLIQDDYLAYFWCQHVFCPARL